LTKSRGHRLAPGNQRLAFAKKREVAAGAATYLNFQKWMKTSEA
jgi:hypothetical protein